MHFLFFEALAIAIALSIDAFVASIAYGSNKIKMPFSSIQIIALSCTTILTFSLIFGSLLKQYLNPNLTNFICFIILFILGSIKLMDSTIKTITKKYINNNNNFLKELHFSLFNISFILSLYSNPELADIDKSKKLTAKEALSLAIALSIDGAGVGIGAALGNTNILFTIILSFITCVSAIKFGCYLGNKIANKINFDLSWLSGILLIIIAILKIKS